MDQPETVAEAPPEAPTQDRVIFRGGGRLSLREILKLYDAGRSFLRKRDHERWRDTFALGVSVGGLFTGMNQDGDYGLLAVFWRTDNPVVDLRVKVPTPSDSGAYAYVCWLWNAFGMHGLVALKAHLARTLPEVRYIAHHDERKKSDQRRSEVERRRGTGALVVKPLSIAVEVDALLAGRNGSH